MDIEKIVEKLDNITNNNYSFYDNFKLLNTGIITVQFFYNYICNVVYELSKKDMDLDKRITIYEKITSLVFMLNQLDD